MTVYYFSLLIITYGDYVPPAVLARYLTLSFIFRDGRAALPPPLPRRPPVVNRRRRNAFRPPVPEKALQISWL